MEAESRPPNPSVTERKPAEVFAAVEEAMREDPTQFEFFQAVRMLERSHPERAPVGGFARPEDEAVRFGAHASLAFPASQIQEMNWPEGEQPEMTVNFMGLTGPQGVLPYYYTRLVIERMREKDDTMRSFFDIFNHRLISLFYRAWGKYRFPVSYERGDDNRFSAYIRSFIGLGTPGLEDRLPIPDEALLFYAGLLGPAPGSAAMLEAILADYFGVAAEVEQFVGAWQPLDVADQCSFEGFGDSSEQLGRGMVAGDEVWNQQSRARIRLGPMPRERYEEFLPDGPAHEPLRAMTRLFSGDAIEFELQLVLEREDVPRCDLDQESPSAPRLGWTSWVKSGDTFDRDPGDTIILLT